MKRFIFIALFLVCCLCMNGFISMPKNASEGGAKAVIQTEFDGEKALESHIINLLNLNNVYGDDFTDNERLVNKAAISMRSYANANGFIEEGIITAFVKDMYDIDLVITDDINKDMPQRDGFVYLIPRGYTLYSHDITDITDMGEYLSVTSGVKVLYHDNYVEIGTATTKLVKNANGSFGYSIMDAQIVYNNFSLVV